MVWDVSLLPMALSRHRLTLCLKHLWYSEFGSVWYLLRPEPIQCSTPKDANDKGYT